MVVSLDGRTTDRLRYAVARGHHLMHLDPIRGPRQYNARGDAGSGSPRSLLSSESPVSSP